MKLTLSITLFAMSHILGGDLLEAQIQSRNEPRIKRTHNPLNHYQQLAKENGWEIQKVGDGIGQSPLHKHTGWHLLLTGEFTEDDNPISSYHAYVLSELSKLGIQVGSEKILYDEDNGYFQTRITYLDEDKIGVVTTTAVLDFRRRFVINITIIESEKE